MSDVATRGERRRSRRTTDSPRKSPAKPYRTGPPPPPPMEDKTELHLLIMSEAEFAAKMDADLGIGKPSFHEQKAMEEVLLPRPRNKVEEDALHARVMQSLRERVIALEKEEDPDFDPACPVVDDRGGLLEDPLQRLSSIWDQQTALRSSVTEMPDKL